MKGQSKRIVFLLEKCYIVQYSIEFKTGISVEQDWTASRKNGQNNKLSYNSVENPKLGHNYRYVRCQFSLVEEGTSVGSLAYKKTLMRCIEELQEKVMVDLKGQLKEVRPACFDCKKLLDFFLFSMTSWLPLDHIINKQYIERFIGKM